MHELVFFGLLGLARARFGQEQVPISAISQVQGGDAGAAATIAGAAISDLLGGANACAKLQRGDQILAELGTGADAVAAAIGMVAAEKNFNPFAQDTPTICSDPALPENALLRGITPLIDPAVEGADAANSLSAETVTAPLNADGKSVADLLTENGFTNFVSQDLAGETLGAESDDVATAESITEEVKAVDPGDATAENATAIAAPVMATPPTPPAADMTPPAHPPPPSAAAGPAALNMTVVEPAQAAAETAAAHPPPAGPAAAAPPAPPADPAALNATVVDPLQVAAVTLPAPPNLSAHPTPPAPPIDPADPAVVDPTATDPVQELAAAVTPQTPPTDAAATAALSDVTACAAPIVETVTVYATMVEAVALETTTVDVATIEATAVDMNNAHVTSVEEADMASATADSSAVDPAQATDMASPADGDATITADAGAVADEAINSTVSAANNASAVDGADFGTCDPTISFEAGRAGRKADEFTFQSNDPVIAANQQDALNPNIITNRICDELVNTCAANDAAEAVCLDAKAQIMALGTKDQTTADAWNALVMGGSARLVMRWAVRMKR